MPRAREITIGWTAPDDTECRVLLTYQRGSPGGREEAPTGPEIEVVEIIEDVPGGALRPDLLAQVDAWIESHVDDIAERAEP
jgi:hypothetical protein